MFSTIGFAQSSMVNSQVETSSIRIGEQFQYKISVKGTENVILPKLVLGKGLEIIDSAKVDTVKAASLYDGSTAKDTRGRETT